MSIQRGGDSGFLVYLLPNTHPQLPHPTKPQLNLLRIACPWDLLWVVESNNKLVGAPVHQQTGSDNDWGGVAL